MVTRSALASLFVLLMALVPAAFAGKTELTTYYPAPYGEYTNLNSKADSNFATDYGNVGIGTTAPVSLLTVGNGNKTYPTTPSGNNAFALSGVSLMRMVMNDGSGLFNQYVNAYWDAASATHKYSVSSYAMRVLLGNGLIGLQVAPSGTAGDDITWTTGLYINNSGNVGIGTTNPTVQFERPCPTGFTNIKKVDNQLGCMQTDESNGGVGLAWDNASDYCFDNYGGRLPSTGEWYISMANYGAIANKIDDWEWNDDACGSNHVASGSTSTTLTFALDDATTSPFRCWIPR